MNTTKHQITIPPSGLTFEHPLAVAAGRHEDKSLHVIVTIQPPDGATPSISAMYRVEDRGRITLVTRSLRAAVERYNGI